MGSHRRQVIQASNVTFLESNGLGLDVSAVRLGLGASSELNSSGRLGLDASAVGLGLGTSSKLNSSSELNSSGRLGLDASAVGLRLSASSGLNLEGNTGRYNLRKKPRAVTHRIQVEEEPMDSADVVDEELRSLAENSTWDYVGLEDVPAQRGSTLMKLSLW